MKPCVTCEFSNRQVMTAPNGQPMVAFACLQPDLGDPITGEPLPCQICRSNAEFCGIKGKMWKQKQAKPIEDKKVIQLI